MVGLATQDEPAEKAKRYPNWTQRVLEGKGFWRGDFDELTGEGIHKWFEERGRNNDDR